MVKEPEEPNDPELEGDDLEGAESDGSDSSNVDSGNAESGNVETEASSDLADHGAEPSVDDEDGGVGDEVGDDDLEAGDFEDDEDAFSLEELGEAYRHIVAQADSDEDTPGIEPGEVLQREHLIAAQAKAEAENAAKAAEEHEEVSDDEQDWDETPSEDEPEAAATPLAIIEAALFVGQPSGDSISPTRLASIMRNMTPDEVEEIIAELNASYREQRQGIRVVQDEGGYRMVVAPEVESMRHVFTGKVRETRLNQTAIEVLSLVAYQPGITSQQCTDLRGRDSGPLLNQMVRRRLIEMKREPEDGEPPATQEDSKAKKKKQKLVSRFYPAERLLVLLGLESLEDLPQVEETHFE
ncbi:SMC-Scp complex subunit ScpB [Neorhodopirellula lusitana]|uniref:SMC-Scp complex subunit ScpB n=1 Tax=Neorhodopirellula lusitana TaxID=445327 RepID=UPI003850F191